MTSKKILVSLFVLLSVGSFSVSYGFLQLPPPADPQHPGSKIYGYDFTARTLRCSGRNVTVYTPKVRGAAVPSGEQFPVVVYGHGQALNLEHYSDTFQHLARKGVAVIYPMYDTGFFDQQWIRMGRDYSNLTACALDQSPELSREKIVFSGHSKGAYVAAISAGLSFKENLRVKPKATVVFQVAGFETSSAESIASSTSLTVVFSDRDTIVDRSFSESLLRAARSEFKQMIVVKSYPASSAAGAIAADHYWPQTKASAFGGRSENALHFYGKWKWLVSAALDLNNKNPFRDRYLYGDQVADKGVADLLDEVIR